MSLHAIKRARERYGVEYTFDDLKEILNLVLEGEAKELDAAGTFEFPKGKKLFHVRYKGRLIKPAVAGLPDAPVITTFMPCGKRTSLKKYFESKQCKDFWAKQKRLKKEK